MGLGLRREHYGSLLRLSRFAPAKPVASPQTRGRIPILPRTPIGVTSPQNAEKLQTENLTSQTSVGELDWFEVAPENYMEIGGKVYKDFCELAERLPIVAHSVSMSLGSLDPLNWDFLKKLKKFIRTHKIPMASDHICFSSYHRVQFDDLVPLPFTEEAVRHVAKRVRQVQDFLEIPYAVENISYYAPSGAAEMKEEEFVAAIVRESGAWLLLDVNNIYVNSVNFGFDPSTYLKAMPLDRLAYVHIAGHRRKRKNFILDTHGAEIVTPVWSLLDELSSMTKIPGIMIERDANIPPLEEILEEVKHIRKILQQGSIHA